MRLTKITTIAALAVVLAIPAFGGTYLESRTTFRSDTPESPQGMGDMMLRSWAEGPNAKIEIQESGNPMLPQGSYMLTNDGGKTFYIVNEEEGTYSKFDLEGLLGMVGSVMEGMGGIMKMEFDDAYANTKVDEAGPRMLGRNTRHVQIESGYTMRLKVMGMKQESRSESVQDIWYVPGLKIEGMSYWLGKEPPKTGNEDLDKMISFESAKVDGLPVKSVVVSKDTSPKGGTTTTTATTEVTVLREENIAAGTFKLDPSLEETAFFNPAMMQGQGEEEEESGGLGSLFGRKKKKKN